MRSLIKISAFKLTVSCHITSEPVSISYSSMFYTWSVTPGCFWWMQCILISAKHRATSVIVCITASCAKDRLSVSSPSLCTLMLCSHSHCWLLEGRICSLCTTIPVTFLLRNPRRTAIDQPEQARIAIVCRCCFTVTQQFRLCSFLTWICHACAMPTYACLRESMSKQNDLFLEEPLRLCLNFGICYSILYL